MLEPSSVKNSPIVVTIDIDWVPDWMIAAVLERLVRVGVSATFFATNPSAVLTELDSDSRFEVGIHPNFLTGSSHGTSPDEVLTNMKSWYPKATACRTHSLVQSEPLLALMASRYEIKIDASIHLPRAAFVVPHSLTLDENGANIVRVPHVFQDNMHALSQLPWTWEAARLDVPGWKVLNFHPIHILSNMGRMADYQRLKEKGRISDLSPEDLNRDRSDFPGAGTLFDIVLNSLVGEQTKTLSAEIADWNRAVAQ
jgi:hypothetical protein